MQRPGKKAQARDHGKTGNSPHAGIILRFLAFIAVLGALSALGYWWWTRPGPAPAKPRTPASQKPPVRVTVITPRPHSEASTGTVERPPAIAPTNVHQVIVNTTLVVRTQTPVAPAERPAITSAPPSQALPPPVVVDTNAFPRAARDCLEAQIVLCRNGFSPGSIDGVPGFQTGAAIAAFQTALEIPVTGQLDSTTRENLLLEHPPFTDYVVDSNDLARLQPLSPSWAGKAQQTALAFENILELVAEGSQANPKLIRQLNPQIDWTRVVAGTSIRVPDVTYPEITTKAAFLVISLGSKTLQIYATESNLVAHFPCSIAQRVEKRPVGELHVAVVAPNPNYTFDPEIFPESPEARRTKTKLLIPPGPNNPVGVAWIGLDKPGYGIHGTPNPEQVGRTESHGCFRLANWNAEYLVRLVWVGMPVYIRP